MALLSAVGRTGSVTAAALAVGMSQPAASATLKALESQLGFSLFTRDRRRLALTASARALLPEITNALAALDSVARLSASLRTGGHRRLVVGTVPAAAASILPQAVQRLKSGHPDLAVILRAGMATEVMEMAIEQRIDLGIILGSGASPHVGMRRLADPGLCCVMTRNHPLARRRRLTIRDVAAHPYVAHARHLPIGSLTAQHLEAAGLGFQPSVEVTQFSAACAFAEAGAGIAVLDSLSGIYARRHGLVVRPLDATGNLSFNLIWPTAKGLHGAVRELADMLEATVLELMRTEPDPMRRTGRGGGARG